DSDGRGLRAVSSERRLLEMFRAVTPDQVRAFQAHRVRALAHIEASFEYKNAGIKKPSLRLDRIALGARQAVPLRVALEEFIFLEHHASLQEKLLHFALPPAQRVATGRSLLLVCLEDRRDSALFRLDFEAAGLNPALARHAIRLKEGDWVVLSQADARRSPWEVVNGRRAVIASLTENELLLFWRDFSSRGHRFRYVHRRDAPVPGMVYVLDEMADDLNADKQVAACREAESNVFYRWIEAGQPPVPHQVPVDILRGARAFGRRVPRWEAPRAPTTRQAEIIGRRLADPILLVQGPPGTGKSHTVGWAVLSRVSARLAAGQSMRVAIVCKTHTAVNIVLESISCKWRTAIDERPASDPLAALEIFKLDPPEDETLPNVVSGLKTYSARRLLDTILGCSPIVVGGTPAGFYNLMKWREAGGRDVLWDEKHFDLVVMDEASQMTLPEAVLATAWLRPDGQALVVGDHRQMPPILAHTWEEEARRHLAAAQPYKSAFEFLRDLGVPVVALDESFRLHRLQAEFLAEQIYRHDGIPFHSRQTHILAPLPPGDPYVDAALRGDVPIVVVEHDEAASQQFNPTEIELISPLVATCLEQLGLEGADGLGVVVPFRAQKAALRDRFPALAASEAIDTVERFQGGERDVIIVSATASDPDYVLAEAAFLLNPNRLTVALSRPRKKLIVVASQALFRLLAADLEVFEHAMLWKRLRYQFAPEPLWAGKRDGARVRVLGCSPVVALQPPQL
ncbi:MAG TPA: hypothetical protein DEP84_05175, partial [Chloroflexi bacterium]|nr:hypothetical protein [Chloroflexota bacterium]